MLAFNQRRRGLCGRSAIATIALAALIGPSADLAQSQTWAERLGYGAGSRVLLIEAPEAGLNWETTEAAAKGLADGSVQSTALLAACPWFGQAAQQFRQQPDLDIGLNVVVTAPYQAYRWRPTLVGFPALSLIDADGFFWSDPRQVSANARREDLERELDAQLESLLRQGIRPTHIWCYQGAVFTRSDLAAAVFRVARRHWIPVMLVDLTPERIARLRGLGLPIDDGLAQMIRAFPLPKVDDLKFSPAGNTYEEHRDAFVELVRGLEPGLTVIHVSPAVETPALQQITRHWRQHVWDAKMLQDPAVKQALDADGVQRTTWREIMRRFDGKPAPAGEGDAP
jgi:predicted glycoside hydrolase/deacetylase ChbG (UPF0249 family)